MESKGVIATLTWEELLALPIVSQPVTFRDALETWAMHQAVQTGMLLEDEVQEHHIGIGLVVTVQITLVMLKLWENDRADE